MHVDDARILLFWIAGLWGVIVAWRLIEYVTSWRFPL